MAEYSLTNFDNECSLCKQVESKLGSDFVQRSFKKELVETSGHLNQAIQRYFKCYMIIEKVERFLENKTLSNAAKGSTSNKPDKEEIYCNSNPLYLNIMKGCLSSESTNGIEIFGISTDFIDNVLKIKQKSELEKDELNNYVEKETDEFCIKIKDYAGFGFKYQHNWKKAFKEAMQELNVEYDYLTLADVQIKSDEAAIKDMYLTYHKELTYGICMLKKLALLYKKKLEFELLLEEYFTKRSTAFSSKNRRFELEILKSTYFNQSIQALNIIRDDLNERKKKLDQLHSETKMSIHYYNVLGPQYAEVVKQYVELCTKVEHQKWTLNSLKSKLSQNDSISKDAESKSFEEDQVQSAEMDDAI